MNALPPDTHAASSPKWQRFKLANGLRVVVQTDRRLPQVAIDLTYMVGSKDEGATQRGFAHLFEHLMFSGTAALPGAFGARLIGLGAFDVNAETSLDATSYRNLVPTGMLAFALYAEADRMGRLGEFLTQQTLDVQRSVVLQEKREREGQLDMEITARTMEMLFSADHPYRSPVLGADDDISSATLDDARSWFARYYVPSNAVLALCGDIDPDDVVPMVDDYFGSLAAGAPLRRDELWIPAPTRGRRLRIEHQAAALNQIRLAWTCAAVAHDDSAMLELFVADLVSDRAGSLRHQLMTVAGDALSVTAQVDLGLLCGHVTIDVVFETTTPARAIEMAVRSYMSRALACPPDAANLDQTKTARADALQRSQELPQGCARVLAFDESRFGNPAWHAERTRFVADVDADSILAAARRWLSCEPVVLEVAPALDSSSLSDRTKRDAPPAPAITISRDLPTFPIVERASLSNGLKIVTASGLVTKGAAIRVVFDRGYADEPSWQRGLTILLTRLWRSTITSSEQSFTAALRAIGMDAQFDVSPTSVSIQMRGPSDAIPVALDYLADLITAPALSADAFKHEQDLIIGEIRRSRSDLHDRVSKIWLEKLFGAGHPLARSPRATEEVTGAYTVADVGLCHDMICRPQNTTIFYAGSQPPDGLVRYFERIADRWKDQQPRPVFDASLPAPRPSPNSLALVDVPGSDVAHLLAGRLLPKHSPSQLAEMAVCHALGGGVTSRLSQRLREDLGWAYHAVSNISRLDRAEIDAMFTIAATVPADRATDAVVEIRSLLRTIVSSNRITSAERDLFVASQTNYIRQVVRDPALVLQSLQQQLLTDTDLGGWAQELSEIGKISLKNIHRSAEKMLSLDQLGWLICGPTALINSQLDMIETDDLELCHFTLDDA